MFLITWLRYDATMYTVVCVCGFDWRIVTLAPTAACRSYPGVALLASSSLSLYNFVFIDVVRIHLAVYYHWAYQFINTGHRSTCFRSFVLASFLFLNFGRRRRRGQCPCMRMAVCEEGPTWQWTNETAVATAGYSSMRAHTLAHDDK